MASLLQSYEQQYSVLTADITSNIGRLKVCADDIKEELSNNIQTNFDEANDLLEQLELEVRGSGASSRVPAYRAELQRIRHEFTLVVNGNSNGYTDNEEFEDWSGGNEQKRKLLSVTDSHSSDRVLRDDYKVSMETGDVGDNTMQELNRPADINRTRGRLRDNDTQPPEWSTRLNNTVLVKSLQDKYLVVMAFMVLGVVMCAGLYFYVT